MNSKKEVQAKQISSAGLFSKKEVQAKQISSAGLFNRKEVQGQVSVEIIIAVFVILIFFILVITQNVVLDSQREVIEISYKEKNSCLEIMFSMSQAFSEGSGTVINLEVEHDFEINSNAQTVIVGEQHCYFLAKTNNYSLQKGEIKLTNNNEVIEIEQVSIS